MCVCLCVFVCVYICVCVYVCVRVCVCVAVMVVIGDGRDGVCAGGSTAIMSQSMAAHNMACFCSFDHGAGGYRGLLPVLNQG